MSGKQDEQDEARLRAAIEAYHASALAYAAVKLGLPGKMGTRRWTAEQLATELGLSRHPLLRFLRGLATICICEERAGGTFALTSLGRSLARGSPSQLGEKVMIVVEQYWRPWSELLHTMQTGTPAFESVFGTDVWTWRSENFRAGDLFAAYLAGETFAHAGPIIDSVDLSAARSAADIGGGHGGLLAAILQAYPEMSGILFDLPGTLISAKKFLKSHGVDTRVTLVGGDFLAEIPVEADVYVLKDVLQHWDDAAARTILESCREAMPEYARLLVIERLMPDRAMDDASAVMVDLHMMAISGSRLRMLDEYRQLVKKAGLALANVTSTRSRLSIIETVPA